MNGRSNLKTTNNFYEAVVKALTEIGLEIEDRSDDFNSIGASLRNICGTINIRTTQIAFYANVATECKKPFDTIIEERLRRCGHQLAIKIKLTQLKNTPPSQVAERLKAIREMCDQLYEILVRNESSILKLQTKIGAAESDLNKKIEEIISELPCPIESAPTNTQT